MESTGDFRSGLYFRSGGRFVFVASGFVAVDCAGVAKALLEGIMRLFRYIVIAGMLCCFAGTAYFAAQQEQAKTSAAEALKKADVTGRLIELTPPHVPKTGAAPSFVVDPAWPKPLPHNWIIGDIGGLFLL